MQKQGNGQTGRSTGEYVRVDFVDDALRLRVIKLASAAGVKPGAVLEKLAEDHLADLEANQNKLVEGQLKSQEAELERQLAAIRLKLGKK